MLSRLSSAVRVAMRPCMSRSVVSSHMICRRPKSSSTSSIAPCKTENDQNNQTVTSAEEIVAFPTTTSSTSHPPSGDVSRNLRSPDNEMEYKPILLNAKEHAVGYLNRILNARVYEAAVETELQHAKNISNELKKHSISETRRYSTDIFFQNSGSI